MKKLKRRPATSHVGNIAEQHVAEYLKAQGHTILCLNWKTRYCEIDIVSRDSSTVYFTEVKFRSVDTWGDGFAYVSNKKIRQMSFAAEFWLHENGWDGSVLLQAASVSSSGTINLVEI